MENVYLWLKALHVVSVLAFASGLAMTSLAMSVLAEKEDQAAMASRIRRWDRRFTSPALLATWVLGLSLATSGGWLVQGWLHFKIGLVVVLSALHGMQMGRLRRIVEGQDLPQRTFAVPILVCIVLIALLAVLKPAT